MRRAGEVYGLQTGAPGGAWWEVDGGNGDAGVSRNWGPASCATASDFDYAVDGDGDGVQAGRDRGAGAVCPRAENVLAHGRGADLKRCSGAATVSLAAAGDTGFGSGCAFVRGDQEWFDGGGGGGVLSSGARRGFFVSAQARDAVGIEDALHGGADGSAADERSLATECGAREPDGATAGRRSEEDSASQDYVSSGGEWRVRASSTGGDQEDTGAVLFLCVERGGVSGAMDVLVRHHGRGRPGVCEICGGSGERHPELTPESVPLICGAPDFPVGGRKIGVLISFSCLP